MSENILSGEKEGIEQQLNDLPDLVAQALEEWGMKKLEREKIEALLHMSFKASDLRLTIADIKAAINADGKRYQAMIEEIKSEAQYKRLYEQLMSAKKISSLRGIYG